MDSLSPPKIRCVLCIVGKQNPIVKKQYCNLLAVKSKSSYNLRSNSGILREPPRSKMLATLGGRAFQAAAPHLQNELLLQLRTIESVEIFKKSVKKFLFRQLFE